MDGMRLMHALQELQHEPACLRPLRACGSPVYMHAEPQRAGLKPFIMLLTCWLVGNGPHFMHTRNACAANLQICVCIPDGTQKIVTI